MGLTTTAGKPGVQTLLICLIIYIIFLKVIIFVDVSSKILITLCLFVNYFGRICLRFSFKEERILIDQHYFITHLFILKYKKILWTVVKYFCYYLYDMYIDRCMLEVHT